MKKIYIGGCLIFAGIAITIISLFIVYFIALSAGYNFLSNPKVTIESAAEIMNWADSNGIYGSLLGITLYIGRFELPCIVIGGSLILIGFNEGERPNA
jgi:hypothetical protein